jgi:hypothetical protein
MNAIAETSEASSLTALGEALESAAGSIRATTGTGVVRRTRNAAGKVGSLVSSGAYHAAYGASYGVVFGGVFLKEFLPESSAVRRGLEQGSQAAIDAVASRRVEEAIDVTEKPLRRRATRRAVPAAEVTA